MLDKLKATLIASAQSDWNQGVVFLLFAILVSMMLTNLCIYLPTLVRTNGKLNYDKV